MPIKSQDKTNRNCGNCMWHDDLSWACCNGESINCADFTNPKDGCDKWEIAVKAKS